MIVPLPSGETLKHFYSISQRMHTQCKTRALGLLNVNVLLVRLDFVITFLYTFMEGI